jgi:hypothetical protein
VTHTLNNFGLLNPFALFSTALLNPVKSKNTKKFTAMGFAAIVATADLTSLMPLTHHAGEAQARIGMPRTPASFAGIRRRTIVRRSAIYVNALPAACVKVVVNGASVWRCGRTYYQAYGSRYVVVYVD